MRWLCIPMRLMSGWKSGIKRQTLLIVSAAKTVPKPILSVILGILFLGVT